MGTTKKVEEFVGVFGFTDEDEFKELTAYLGKHGEFVEEKEIPDVKNHNAFWEIVSITYKVDGDLYELWYQVRTPHAPKDRLCSYGFGPLKTPSK